MEDSQSDITRLLEGMAQSQYAETFGAVEGRGMPGTLLDPTSVHDALVHVKLENSDIRLTQGITYKGLWNMFFISKKWVSVGGDLSDLCNIFDSFMLVSVGTNYKRLRKLTDEAREVVEPLIHSHYLLLPIMEGSSTFRSAYNGFVRLMGIKMNQSRSSDSVETLCLLGKFVPLDKDNMYLSTVLAGLGAQVSDDTKSVAGTDWLSTYLELLGNTEDMYAMSSIDREVA